MPIYKDHSFRLGASGASAEAPVYEINQSIRFDSSTDHYMHRTPSSGGNRDKWTWSCWVKRGHLTDANATLFQAGADGQTANYTTILFNGNSGGAPTLKFNSVISSATKLNLDTTQYFRDISAWYHIVCVYDSGNAVSSERAKIFVNGNRVTSFGTETYPSLNDDSMTNHTVKQSIGRRNQDSSRYMDGYMADIYLLDGYAYGPEYFGTTNSSGIWIPINYNTTTGNYGTNGFKIDGSDSATLGKNVATGNTYASYTSTNLDPHDQVKDTPNNNFAVLNSIDKNSNVTNKNGNLEWTSSAADGGCRSSIFFNTENSDKFYIEAIVGTYGNAFSFGISNPDRSLSGDGGEDLADFYGWYINPAQNWIASGSNPWNTGSNSASTSLHVLQMAVDASDPASIKLYAGINNTYYNSSGGTDGNPSTSANPTATITGSEEWSIGLWNRNSASSNIFVNFGQEGTFGGNKTAGGNSDKNGIGNFFHSVPTGYLALCTRNLFTG